MIKNITIPEKFETILKQNQELEALVKQTAVNFSPLLRDNKLFFFEEYTDHGIEHIERVLIAAEEIINIETLNSNLLSPLDIAVLILSVILHDIGMHVDYATFKAIIENNVYDDVLVKCIDKKTWSQLWEDYLNEVKKFSGKQKISIFGDENWNFSVPDLSHKNSLNGFDKKLIGEFIRRNHARLAQEIAIKGGIVGKENELFLFASNMNPLALKIVGIVARSHGMELRDTFDYLKEVADLSWKKPANINVIFLMVVLRIADYFQIDSTRTDPNLLKLKTFSSPISELEHNKHLSIESTNEWHDDPETLVVLARPTTSLLHLRLIELFNDIQHELDLSWAVLGEIYGKDISSKQPKIKYRRINSNLHKGSSFYNNIDYIPEKMIFEADYDLIKLLISPLYGDNPTYGVRELLQNSLDACKERTFEESKKYNSDYVPYIKVSIDYSGTTPSFIIRDNGKGMSLFEIKNYFLKAGASFRKSLDWKQSYTDENGKPLVERTGRFGVGVLAAFLIGQEIEVTTRNIKEDIGYTFRTLLDTEQIEITKVSNLEVGTTISINTNYTKLSTLSKSFPIWHQWYRLKSPQILYEIINKTETKAVYQSHNDPVKDEQLPDSWHKIDISGFGEVHWTYPVGSTGASNQTSHSRPNYTTCNGILIPDGYNIEALNNKKQVVHILPRTNIFDEYGILPLTLNRNSIDGDLVFGEKLLEDISKDFLAKLLMFQPKSKIHENIIDLSREKFKHPCSGTSYDIYLNQEGFTINFSPIRRRIANKYKYIKLNTIDSDHLNRIRISEEVDLSKYIFLYEKKDFLSISSYKESIDPFYYYGTSGGIIYLKTKFYNDVFKGNKPIVRGGFHRDHVFISEHNSWSEISYNFNEKGSLSINDLKYKDSLHSMIVFSGKNFPYPSRDSANRGLTPLNNLLDKYFGAEFIIPYDMEKRMMLYKSAFLDLEPYMRKYQIKA